MLKSILPLIAAPVLLPTLGGIFAVCIALAPVVMLALVIFGLILKSRD